MTIAAAIDSLSSASSRVFRSELLVERANATLADQRQRRGAQLKPFNRGIRSKDLHQPEVDYGSVSVSASPHLPKTLRKQQLNMDGFVDLRDFASFSLAIDRHRRALHMFW
jgi:hypothetical protein